MFWCVTSDESHKLLITAIVVVKELVSGSKSS